MMANVGVIVYINLFNQCKIDRVLYGAQLCIGRCYQIQTSPYDVTTHEKIL